MTRKGSDVRGATIAKAAPQVIVSCGYLMDVIISPCRRQPYCKRFGNGSNPLVGLKMPTSEKWQEVTYLRVCVTSTNEIRMRQSTIRVQVH